MIFPIAFQELLFVFYLFEGFLNIKTLTRSYYVLKREKQLKDGYQNEIDSSMLISPREKFLCVKIPPRFIYFKVSF